MDSPSTIRTWKSLLPRIDIQSLRLMNLEPSQRNQNFNKGQFEITLPLSDCHSK